MFSYVLKNFHKNSNATKRVNAELQLQTVTSTIGRTPSMLAVLADHAMTQ